MPSNPLNQPKDYFTNEKTDSIISLFLLRFLDRIKNQAEAVETVAIVRLIPAAVADSTTP